MSSTIHVNIRSLSKAHKILPSFPKLLNRNFSHVGIIKLGKTISHLFAFLIFLTLLLLVDHSVTKEEV